jgi:hypothetical protein
MKPPERAAREPPLGLAFLQPEDTDANGRRAWTQPVWPS